MVHQFIKKTKKNNPSAVQGVVLTFTPCYCFHVGVHMISNDPPPRIPGATCITPPLPCSGVTARDRVCMHRRMWHPVDRMQPASPLGSVRCICVRRVCVCLCVFPKALHELWWADVAQIRRIAAAIYMTVKVTTSIRARMCVCVFVCHGDTLSFLHNTYRHNSVAFHSWKSFSEKTSCWNLMLLISVMMFDRFSRFMSRW